MQAFQQQRHTNDVVDEAQKQLRVMVNKMLRYVLREHERLDLGLKRLDFFARQWT